MTGHDAAIEAARTAFESTRNAQPYPSMAWRDDEAGAENDLMDTEAFAAAITAYQRARAADVRAAVALVCDLAYESRTYDDTMVLAADMNVPTKYPRDPNGQWADAVRALLALFGVEDEG